VRNVGVLGSLVWDVIHGRDPAAPPTEEWGGIAYALAGMDAALPADCSMVPLIKVGRDLRREADAFLRGLTRLAAVNRCVEVDTPNNRVVLRYETSGRRCERMSGGVPGWTWSELGPMLQDLDALYLNFISGFELGLGTAQALRQGFKGPIYADLHSLFLGMGHDGVRIPRALPELSAWLACFDLAQMNDEEMALIGDNPLEVAAQALDAGLRLLLVTAGARGAIYVAAPGFDRLAGVGAGAGGTPGPGGAGGTVRSARVPGRNVETLDPTGCGDVFGATCFARLLAGDPVERAIAEANRQAARNAGFRGATGLAAYLRGALVGT